MEKIRYFKTNPNSNNIYSQTELYIKYWKQNATLRTITTFKKALEMINNIPSKISNKQ